MKIIKALQMLALLLFYVNCMLASPSPCGNSYGQHPCLYLPALPGSTPKCATKGATFCETVDGYPENLITKLLKNYVSKDILADETNIDFDAKKEPTYSIPPFDHDHHHGRFYGPAVDNHHFNNNNLNYRHHQRGFYNAGNSFMGYHYQRPKSSSSTFFQIKPSTSFHLNHPDMYRRSARAIPPFMNDTEVEAPQKPSLNRFIDTIKAKKTKRQVSASREELCEVRSNYINPQAALNVRTGNWMYIVNGAETATQLVRTEICVSSECSNLCQLPNGYNSRCEQKYVQKRLVTLDPQGEKLFTDTFWFPSCCVCTLSNSTE